MIRALIPIPSFLFPDRPHAICPILLEARDALSSLASEHITIYSIWRVPVQSSWTKIGGRIFKTMDERIVQRGTELIQNIERSRMHFVRAILLFIVGIRLISFQIFGDASLASMPFLALAVDDLNPYFPSGSDIRHLYDEIHWEVNIPSDILTGIVQGTFKTIHLHLDPIYEIPIVFPTPSTLSVDIPHILDAQLSRAFDSAPCPQISRPSHYNE